MLLISIFIYGGRNLFNVVSIKSEAEMATSHDDIETAAPRKSIFKTLQGTDFNILENAKAPIIRKFHNLGKTLQLEKHKSSLLKTSLKLE